MSLHLRTWRAALFVAFGALAAVSSRADGQETLGTISAVVDGEALTWYVVSKPVDGRPQATGVWYENPYGSDTVIVIGGMETEDPPLESFEYEDQMPTSYGTYEGSVIGVFLSLSGGSSSFSVTLPFEDPSAMNITDVTFQRRASIENMMETAYLMGEGPGVVDVSRAEISGGRATLEGTFSGTLHLMSGEGALEITGGTFSVRGIPNIEEIRR